MTSELAAIILGALLVLRALPALLDGRARAFLLYLPSGAFLLGLGLAAPSVMSLVPLWVWIVLAAFIVYSLAAAIGSLFLARGCFPPPLLWQFMRHAPGAMVRGLGAAGRNWPSTLCLLVGCGIVLFLGPLLLAHMGTVGRAVEAGSLVMLAPNSLAAWLADALGGPESAFTRLLFPLLPGCLAVASGWLVVTLCEAQVQVQVLNDAEEPGDRAAARYQGRRSGVVSLGWAALLLGLLPIDAEMRRLASAVALAEIESSWILDLVLASLLKPAIDAVATVPGGFALAYLVGFAVVANLSVQVTTLKREDRPPVERAREESGRR